MITSPDAARCLALLTALHERHGSQVFGQQMQRLLAHTFRRAGYTVTSNPVGVPDFVASKGSPPAGYAVEAKTGTILLLSERELGGIRSSAHTAVVAMLVFPDRAPRWLFLDGRGLEPGRYPIYRVARRRLVTIDFDANLLFAQLLATFHESAMDGSHALEHSIRGERTAQDPSGGYAASSL